MDICLKFLTLLCCLELSTADLVLLGNEYFHKSDTIRLICIVTEKTKTPKNVDWFKNGDWLRPFNTSRMKFKTETSVRNRQLYSKLEILNSNFDDAASYICKHAEYGMEFVRVHPLDGPINPANITPDIVLNGNNFVTSGDLIRLICNVTANSKITEDVEWFRNGVSLQRTNSSRINTKNERPVTQKQLVSILEIQDSNVDDDGLYICRYLKMVIASLAVNVKNETNPKTDKRGTAGNITSKQMVGRQCWSLLALVIVIMKAIQSDTL